VGSAFFEAAAAAGLEGIIAKDGASPYRTGARSREWLKVKTHLRQEVVIAGFTEPRGSRKDLGALILGVYEGGELVYVGHTGGGFDRKGLTSMRGRLEPLMQERCPFRRCPPTNAPAHWLRPELVCAVSFQEWTTDGVMRQPIFLGLREDKNPHTVRREVPVPTGLVGLHTSPVRPRPSRGGTARVMPNGSVHNAAPSGNGQAIALTNLSKVYWPTEGYTKGDLIEWHKDRRFDNNLGRLGTCLPCPGFQILSGSLLSLCHSGLDRLLPGDRSVQAPIPAGSAAISAPPSQRNRN
jgi:bifunctional non-homologous end joining protein LigD